MTSNGLGTLVVDERWRFDIQSIALSEGKFVVTAKASGLPAVPEQAFQCVILDPDGREVTRFRVRIGWPEVNDTVFIVQPVEIVEAIGSAGPW